MLSITCTGIEMARRQGIEEIGGKIGNKILTTF
jgi:hypothetical protein